MKTILIADDELLARQVFKTLIQRNFTDVEVIAEAENGRQAYELACSLKPDIIAMDIKMPGLNGIDASRAILKAMPEAQILVLTAYDSFDYLKEAFEIGVKGYLLKPVKVEQLVEKINSIFHMVAQTHLEKNRYVQMESNLAVAQAIVEKELVSAYVNGNETAESLAHYHNFLQLSSSAGFFISILIEPPSGISINDHIRYDILKSKARKLVTDSLPLMGKALAGDFISNILPVFVPLGEHTDIVFALQEAKLIAYEILRKITGNLAIDCCAAIGRIYHNPTDFCRSYSESISLLACLVPMNVAVFSDEKPAPFAYPYRLEAELLDQILVGDTAGISQTTAQIVHAVFTTGCSFSRSKEYFIELFVLLKRHIASLGIDLKLLDSDIKISQIEAIRQIDELHTYIQRAMGLIINALNQKNANHNIALVHKIQRYLAEEDLAAMSLESLADKLNLSVQYVSKLFKEEFGKNFIDYLTSYKIERAKLLLRTNHKSVSEVALCVGYNDPNYFCRIFKKITGITPKEFQKIS